MEGKLSEFAIYRQLTENFYNKAPRFTAFLPDFQVTGSNYWDNMDLAIYDKSLDRNISLAVKSTKSFGSLLFLEKGDWHRDGTYLTGTNFRYFDYFFLVRIDWKGRNKLRMPAYSSEKQFRSEVSKLFVYDNFYFDCPGFVPNSIIREIIDSNQCIHQGDYLLSSEKDKLNLANRLHMDADNYYLQACDFCPLNQLIDCLKDIE